MRHLYWIAVFLIALIPLVTLVHRNDLGRWETQHSAMAAPDEFSYLLLADNLLHGHGISTQATLGRDTFYPPGYPLLLAGWSALVGLTLFHAHLLNALLLCIATLVVFAFSRRLLTMLAQSQRSRFQFSTAGTSLASLLIAALFATNWHVLEGALYVFSEPAFMLATFAWIALAVRWPEWPRHSAQTLLISLLAIAAWSIRGAGIVCVATLLVYPGLAIFRERPRMLREWWLDFLRPIAIVVLTAAIYQLAIHLASPEKSLAGGAAVDNSYTHQLLHGLTKNGTINPLDPQQFPQFLWRVGDLLLSHLDDYAMSFTPWFRESPDFHLLNITGKILGLLAMLGWLHRLLRRESATRFLEIYVLFYVALYLVWPFNMTRFWAPILPLMLVYAVDAIRQFWTITPRISPPRISSQGTVTILLTLLLTLHAEELFLQLGNYERRLNYVSDALAAAARSVERRAGDPSTTTLVVAGTDEHFLYAWYLRQEQAEKLPRYLPSSPEPHLQGPGSRRETVEELLIRQIQAAEAAPERKLFVASYFTDPDYAMLFKALSQTHPELFQNSAFVKIFQKEIIAAVWELRRNNSPRPHS